MWLLHKHLGSLMDKVRMRLPVKQGKERRVERLKPWLRENDCSKEYMEKRAVTLWHWLIQFDKSQCLRHDYQYTLL